MVVVLIFAVLAQVVAGLFSADTDTGMVTGPLTPPRRRQVGRRATAFHSFWVNVLLVLVGLHVLAAIVYLVWKRQNLIGAMIHGHKPLDDVVPPGQARAAPAVRLGPAGDLAADRLPRDRLLHRPLGWLKPLSGRAEPRPCWAGRAASRVSVTP